ncbi:MAG: MCE family protein [Chitinophagaceae bacterium]|nr:MCE family protein [Chitinophagaceae bacterium]
MNISATQKTKTGLFVLFALLLLLGLILVISNQKRLFSNTFLAYVEFNNIGGTQEGNFVRFAGINIGTVESINIINDTTVRLGLSIEKKLQRYIKSDAVANIGSDGLMGDKLILISPGNEGSLPIKSGGLLRSTNPINLDKVLNKLSRITDNIIVVTDGLATVMDKINSGKGSIGRLLADEKLANQMESTIATAQATAKSIKKTASSANESLEAAKSSFLLRGYFKRKEKKRIKDSTEKANKMAEPVKKE